MQSKQDKTEEELQEIADTLMKIVDDLSDNDMEKVASILIGAILSKSGEVVEEQKQPYIS